MNNKEQQDFAHTIRSISEFVDDNSDCNFMLICKDEGIVCSLKHALDMVPRLATTIEQDKNVRMMLIQAFSMYLANQPDGIHSQMDLKDEDD